MYSKVELLNKRKRNRNSRQGGRREPNQTLGCSMEAKGSRTKFCYTQECKLSIKIKFLENSVLALLYCTSGCVTTRPPVWMATSVLVKWRRPQCVSIFVQVCRFSYTGYRSLKYTYKPPSKFLYFYTLTVQITLVEKIYSRIILDKTIFSIIFIL